MHLRFPVVWYGASALVSFYLNGVQDGGMVLSAPPSGNFPSPGNAINGVNGVNGVGASNGF
jgi:hypothetical protein